MSNGASGASSHHPIVLAIAGFDPSAGAGIAADLKTIAAHNVNGIAAITALTVQNTQGVRRVEPVGSKLLAETLEALAEDIPISAVKIGMLGSVENLRVVVAFLEKRPDIPVVLDPVWHATSGAALLSEKAWKELRAHLLGRVTVVTPNLEEAAALAGFPVTNVEEMKRAASELVAAGAKNAIVTGGHLEKPVDVLFDGVEHTLLSGDRFKNGNTHGTGCAFSTAVAVNLALGHPVAQSAVLAKAYISKAIEHGFALGKGAGQPNHLYRLDLPTVPRAGGSEPHHMDAGHR
jgi:hydroxymethylpyrimidine/phosphomethylpyrimidine kinase